MSIHKLKNGKYQVRWRVTGKLKAKNFSRKIDADKFEAKVTLNTNASDGSVPQKEPQVKFETFAEIWLELHGAKKEERSQVLDRQFLRDYITPSLGQMPLNQIKPTHLLDMQEKLRRTLNRGGRRNEKGEIRKLSSKTVNLIMGLVKKMLNCAVKWEYLVKNPMLAVDNITLPEQETKFWKVSERDKFLKWAKANDQDLFDLTAMSLFCGLRRGELQGLRSDAVSLEEKTITIKRSYCAVSRVEKQYTKSKRIRIVPINDLVFEILSRRLCNGLSGQIFKVDFDHIVERWFKPAQKRAGVPVITWHQLRHSFASHLAMSSTSVFDIQSLLGHSDLRTTQRYMHLDPKHLQGKTQILVPEFYENNKGVESPSK